MPVTYAETPKAFIMYAAEAELTDDVHFDLDRAFLRAFKKDYKYIIIDVTESETMNSMFISVLMNSYIQLRELGGDMILVGVSSHVDYLLRVVRLRDVFTIYKTVDEAVSSLPNEPEAHRIVEMPLVTQAQQA